MPPKPEREQRRSADRPVAVTIVDVAREAGVAASTVSRAFSNPGRVNVVTREHVLQVAAGMGYRPNPVARALGTGRTSMIALALPDIANPYFTGTIRGVEQEAAAAGYVMLIGDGRESGEREHTFVSRVVQAVDGIILCSSRMLDREIAAIAKTKPTVLVGRSVRGVRSVVPDQLEGAEQIIDHLASLGHRRIAFAAGPRVSWLGRQRWSGISTAGRRAGLDTVRLGPFPPTIPGGLVAAEAALRTSATAVIAHNDLMAIGVLRRLTSRGKSVPRDVSVVGFDDIFGADFCQPPLTTLGHRTFDAGRAAIEHLVEIITSADLARSRETVMPMQLVIRESSGPAAS